MCLSLNKMVLGLIITNINFIISYCTKKRKRKEEGKKEKKNIITWQYPIARKKL